MTTPETRTAIERRIRDFDVSALLDLLRYLGYPDGALRRAGHFTVTPQPTWLDAIQFGEDQASSGGPTAPHAKDITIVGNLGLRSCRSPLPSYFGELMEDPDIQEPLAELLEFLDDRLLERRFASYRPDRDPSVFPSFPDTKSDFLSLGGLRSPAALHWLFHKVFPELRITVRRAPHDHRAAAPDIRLGKARLGSAALGGLAIVSVRSLEVTLIAEGRMSCIPGVPWVDVVSERLTRLVFPALRDTGVQLMVALLLLDRGAQARLDGGTLETRSYVGYDPFRRRRMPRPGFRRATRRNRGLMRARKRRPSPPRRIRRSWLRRLFAQRVVRAKAQRVIVFSGPIPFIQT